MWALGIRRRALSTLVVADHVKGAVQPATLNAITAAASIGASPVRVLVTGGDKGAVDSVAKSVSGVDGVDGVFAVAHDAYSHLLAENVSSLVANLHQKEKFSHILFPATTFGKNVAPRLAALLDVAVVSDIISVGGPDTFTRPVYAGNAIATVKSKDPVKVVTVRPTAFAAAASSGKSASIADAAVPDQPETGLTKWVSEDIVKSDRPELASAKVIVAGGRALKSAENFNLLYKLADILNGAVGASRAAVDAGFCSNDLQIGQTGKVVAPDLYIAIGISGAIQHLAGMKDSKVIVAINKDKEAPIFQIADYGLVGDLFTIIPALEKALSK
ncbi:Electron transfer flavoprotein subunit alpha [Plasmodiophora brassicae]